MDRTGKVQAQLRWPWTVSEQVTSAALSRGADSREAAEIPKHRYAGSLIHNDLALYYKFLEAAHQSCAAYLIRRCRDLRSGGDAYGHSVPRRREQLQGWAGVTGSLPGAEDLAAWTLGATSGLLVLRTGLGDDLPPPGVPGMSRSSRSFR
jgi:Transposase IS66 family